MNSKWRVEFDERAAKELRKLDPGTRRKILEYLRDKVETELDPQRFGKALTSNLAGL